MAGALKMLRFGQDAALAPKQKCGFYVTINNDQQNVADVCSVPPRFVALNAEFYASGADFAA
jgi:hypothetical protein